MNKRLKKKNPQMAAALTVGAIINVVFLLILGGFTVYSFVEPEEVALQAPPPLVPLEPPVVKYNQKKTQERSEKSQRPQQQRIQTKAVSNISTPAIDIQIANVSPAVTVDSSLVQTAGNVGGLGGGGLRMGVSAVDFFGIKSEGERIVIILDIARSMLEPARGDIPGFLRVKEKLVEVVDGLNSATLFNLMIFSNGLDVMSNSLILANAENKQRAADFVEPYWKAEGGRFAVDAKRAVFRRNYTPNFEFIKPIGGSSRMDMALMAAFEQGADAIFMITDGTPELRRELAGREITEYEKKLAEYEKRRAKVSEKEIAEYNEKRRKFNEMAHAKIKAIRAAEAKKRAAKGLDAVVRENSNIHIPGAPASPFGHKPRHWVGLGADERFVKFVKKEAKRIYQDRREKLPTVNVVGYSIPEKGKTADFLKDLRRAFPGSKFETFGEYVGEESA